MELSRAQILIELEAGSNPVAGSVRAGAGPARSFTGWTGLFAVLRAATCEEIQATDAGSDE